MARGKTLLGVGLVGDPRAEPPGRRRIFKNSLKKIAKNGLFLHIFLKINKPCVSFSRVWTKKQIIGKFSDNLKIFDENSIKN